MRVATHEERDALILQIIRRIDTDTQVVGAPERTAVWEAGWAEALAKFRASPCKESLIPAFIRPDQPMRIDGDLYVESGDFEREYVRIVQKEVIAPYIENCKVVEEFGCGTGFNMVALSQLLPEIWFAGFDFSQSAVYLVREVGSLLKQRITAMPFNMLEPRALPKADGVFTFGAIEQLAGNFRPFIDWLIARKPAIVVHIEPTIELYDPDKLLDYLAIKFHRKRGYTEGLLPYLRNHADVRMVEVKRHYVGSMMLEGYVTLAWRPK